MKLESSPAFATDIQGVQTNTKPHRKKLEEDGLIEQIPDESQALTKPVQDELR